MPTDLVIGDFYIIHEYDEKLDRYRTVLDYQITNDSLYDTVIGENPDRRITKPAVHDIPHNSIYNLRDLMHVFYSLISLGFTGAVKPRQCAACS